MTERLIWNQSKHEWCHFSMAVTLSSQYLCQNDIKQFDGYDARNDLSRFMICFPDWTSEIEKKNSNLLLEKSPTQKNKNTCRTPLVGHK